MSTTKLRFYTDLEMEARPKPEWLVEELLPVGGLASLYGPPSSGKSFVALDLALSIAAGVPWAGRAVRQGAVVYIAAERGAGFGARIFAWKEHHGLSAQPLPIHFLPRSISLPGKETDELLQAIKELRDQPPILIVVDTLAKTIQPFDENKTVDMGAYVLNLTKLQEEFGCAVHVVHHTNAEGKRERGNSALRGAADTMLRLSMSRSVITITCDKQSEADEGQKLRLRLTPVGESAVPTMLGLPESEVGAIDGLSESERRMLRALSTEAGLAATAWQRASGVAGSTFYRVRSALIENGYVRQSGRTYTLSAEGRAAAALTPTSLSDRSHESDPTSLPTLTPIGGG